MSTTWLGRWFGKGTRRAVASPSRFRPQLESLEDRAVPAAALQVQSLAAGGITPTFLAQELFPGLPISNVSYTGSNFASGTFSNADTLIGIPQGIVLDSGRVQDLPGPNTGGSGTNFNLPGDPLLDNIVAPVKTFDAVVLQFDVIPNTSSITFTYVFGSQEYNNFINDGFPDIFGLFVNGQNVALVPGTGQPITVDNINLNQNSQLYINNAGPGDPFPTTTPINIHLNGLTTMLHATASVTPGQLNHIRLSVADAGDGIFDSAAFIQAGVTSSAGVPGAGVFGGVSSFLTAYRPFRYAFRSLEENTRTSGPIPLSGPAADGTFDGNVTIVNNGPDPAKGPIGLVFHGLPEGVQLVNASGTDPKTGDPLLTFSVLELEPGEVLRVPVKFRNPLHKPLGTFFEGPYFVDVLTTV
jgi:hypothetical protein